MNSDSRATQQNPRAKRGPVNYGHLPSFVGYRVRKAYTYLFQTFNAMLKGLSLAPGQYSVLLLIGLNPGLSQMDLAEATGLDGSTLVPITNRFEKLGWIRRTRRKDDRRFYSLRITARGQSILDSARPIIDAHERQLVSGLSERECHTLIDLLARISEPQRTQPRRKRVRTGARQIERRDSAA